MFVTFQGTVYGMSGPAGATVVRGLLVDSASGSYCGLCNGVRLWTFVDSATGSHCGLVNYCIYVFKKKIQRKDKKRSKKDKKDPKRTIKDPKRTK